MKLNDCEKTGDRRSTLCKIYIVAYLLVLAVCAESEALTNNGVVIPFIKMNQALPLLAIIAVGIAVILLVKHMVVDTISALLLGRIVLCALPAMLYDVPLSYVGNFVVACFPLLIYTFFLSCDMELSKTLKVFLVFGLIIAIQCIWAYIVILKNGYAEYSDPYYKNFFVIPVGATNNISAVLLPIVILGDQTIEKKPVKLVYTALLLVALFFCKSRTGLILAILYLIVRLFTKNNGKHSWMRKVAIFLLPIIIFLMIIAFNNTSVADSIVAFFVGNAESGESWEALFSDRIVVYSNVWEKISNHVIFGNGVTYEQLDYIRPHNVILQMWYENGIFGLVGFLMFLYVAIGRMVRAKAKNKYFYAFAVSAPFIFINAMVEDTMISNFMVLYGLFFLANMNKEDDCEELKNVQG